MSDLVAWVRAQLDERERIALAAIADDGGQDGGFEDAHYLTNGIMLPRIADAAAELIRTCAVPRDVLADVEAKRDILDYAERIFANAREHPGDLASKGAFLAMRVIVRNLAEGFRHRDGYEEAISGE